MRAAVRIVGCDFSSKCIDLVALDVDSDRATWHRFALAGADAFDRARSVRAAMPGGSFWDDCLAVGIEQPRGRFALVDLGRIQGAVLSCLPSSLLVQPWNPASWRTAVGLAGNAPKEAVSLAVLDWRVQAETSAFSDPWPQDACDAYCVALATRQLVQHKDAA